MPRKGEGRVLGPRSTSGGQQTSSGREGGWPGFSLAASEGTSPTNTVTLDFRPPELCADGPLMSPAPSLRDSVMALRTLILTLLEAKSLNDLGIHGVPDSQAY